jgi:hypothetical protein
MITATLKAILTASGCTLVIYEQDKLAGIYTDQSDQTSIVGLVTQLNTMTLESRANAIHEHYAPLYIEVMQQVSLEDSADNNEVRLQNLLNICKQVIVRIIAEGTLKHIGPVPVEKILENKYDANVIGWIMTLDLYYLLNENRDPCISP